MFFGDLSGNGINIRTSSFRGGPAFQRQFRTFHSGQFQNHHQHQQRRQGSSTTNRFAQFLQLLPVIVLLLFSFANSFIGSDYGNTTSFSWERTALYSSQRLTSFHGVKYFVDPRTFTKAFLSEGKQSKLQKFEDSVENQVQN